MDTGTSSSTFPKREGAETLGLYLAGLDNTFANGGRWFSRLHLRQLFEGNGLNLTMDIDTVQQRTANLIHIALNLSRSADAMMRGISIVTAGTRIAAGHKHKRTRIFNGVFGTADGDVAVFQGLAQNFQCTFVELRELVAKEYPVVCQGNLSRLRITATTYQSNL
jgi:hypothetical protein